MSRPPPAECAQCGAPIPRHAKACPECGADERTGWREADPADGLDLPASAYDGDSGTRPAGRPAPHRVNGLAWYWFVLAAALIAPFVNALVGGR